MKLRLRRPGVDTRFHVDWDWYARNNLDAASLIRGQLSEEDRARLDGRESEEVDYVNPVTGEVLRVDRLREAIMADYQWQPDYIPEDMPLMQAILRIFLANNNEPMDAVQIAQRLGRHDPEAILRLLTASGVQNGVVPVRG